MPSLRLVSDPDDEPLMTALAVAGQDRGTVLSDGLPIHWFDCTDAGVGAAVRAHLLTVLNDWVVDTDTMADAMVLVSELVTNVRDHTRSESLGLRVRVTSDRIVVAVVEHDPGPPSDHGRLGPRAADGPAPGAPASGRGRGLPLLDSMASHWGFVRSAGTTTSWFALPAVPPIAAPHEPEFRRF